MYGFSCTVYLCGQEHSYVGTFQRPWSREGGSFDVFLGVIGKEVTRFLEEHAGEGTYEVGLYIESSDVSTEPGSLPWWHLLGASTPQMVWHEEVQASWLTPDGKGA